MRRLYVFANATRSPHKDAARMKLKRWGFNYERKCCIHDVCEHSLVRTPGTDEVFPSIDYRDKMHGMTILLHRMLMETFQHLHLPAGVKRMLDRRLSFLGERRCFRDSDGKAYRLQRSIFTDVGMTAQDKFCVIFLLPHVLGPQADTIIDRRLHDALLTAIARAQLMLIAARGLRSYTLQELRRIYDEGYLLFFGALESIQQMLYQKRLALHECDPDSNPPPKKPKRQERYAENTDTDDTSDDSTVGGLGIFSHGPMNLVHQHWVMQFKSAGSLDVHNTQGAEADHKLCMKLASSRVRHLSANKTQHSMLLYLCFHGLFEELKKFIPDFKPSTRRSNTIHPGVLVPLLQTAQDACHYEPTMMHMRYHFASPTFVTM